MSHTYHLVRTGQITHMRTHTNRKRWRKFWADTALFVVLTGVAGLVFFYIEWAGAAL